MKIIWMGILALLFSLQSWGASFDDDFKQAHDLMFKTHRTDDQLQKALDIYAKLYRQSDKSDISIPLILEYAYALYYKSDYTYPQEGEKGYKESLPERLKFYQQADGYLDPLLDDESRLKTNSLKAELFFVAGMIKAEIASLTSSPFMVIKGRKLLEKALEKDKTLRNGGIYLGLGRLYARTPRILFGNKDRALGFLSHALEDFSPPSLIGFYFKMDTILDGREFQKLLFIEKKDILELALGALKWEQKRRPLPVSNENFITPEETDSLNMIWRDLKEWKYSTNVRELEKQIAKMKE